MSIISATYVSNKLGLDRASFLPPPAPVLKNLDEFVVEDWFEPDGLRPDLNRVAPIRSASLFEHPAWCRYNSYTSSRYQLRGYPPGTFLLRPSHLSKYDQPQKNTFYFCFVGVNDNHDIEQTRFVWVDGKIYGIQKDRSPVPDFKCEFARFEDILVSSRTKSRPFTDILKAEMTRDRELELVGEGLTVDRDFTLRTRHDPTHLLNKYPDLRGIDFSYSRFIFEKGIFEKDGFMEPTERWVRNQTARFIKALTQWKIEWPGLKTINLTGCALDAEKVRKAFADLTVVDEAPSVVLP